MGLWRFFLPQHFPPPSSPGPTCIKSLSRGRFTVTVCWIRLRRRRRRLRRHHRQLLRDFLQSRVLQRAARSGLKVMFAI